ncbi:hypothetical protein MC885_020003 [Smutsia gigantea]|nr:hypothetical protein MC885_020003 [Smutsia gigantea]
MDPPLRLSRAARVRALSLEQRRRELRPGALARRQSAGLRRAAWLWEVGEEKIQVPGTGRVPLVVFVLNGHIL